MDAMVTYAAAVAPASEFKGRWGYYPCDYETYREIKELHRFAYKDLRATLRRKRWLAKLPYNRRGPEPKAVGTTHDLYNWILQEYRNVRYPKPTAALVVPSDMPRGWRETLRGLREFHAEAAEKGAT